MPKKTIKKLSSKKLCKFGNVNESDAVSGKNIAVSVIMEDENSLEPHEHDGDYHFTADERQFISLWIEFRNIVIIASMMNMSQKECSMFFTNPHVMNEIARISRARMKRRFACKILTLDECESYLTSCITDDNVPISEQMTNEKKLVAMKLLLEVKEMKADGLVTPSVLDNMPLETEIQELSISTIKALLSTKIRTNKQMVTSIDMRQKVAAEIPYVTPEEEQDIMNATPDELVSMLDKIKNAKKDCQDDNI